MAAKTLILIRHAHRDTSDRSLDNGLSPKGKVQVKRLLRYWRRKRGDERAVFYSSPKARCMETLQPLAEDSGEVLQSHAELTEQDGASENAEVFAARVKRFLSWWQKDGPPLLVVCSHGDWLPLAIELATGARVALKKAGWCEIRRSSAGKAELRWLLQRT